MSDPITALRSIAEYPIAEQDNMNAANMRRIAEVALAACATGGIDRTIADAAKAYATDHAVAAVGDVVETTWSHWKRPQMVRIISVGAHLVCRYDDAAKDWIAGFAMTYVAERLRSDGTTKERNGGGICLDNLQTANGRAWLQGGRFKEETGFNHAGLEWSTMRNKRVALSKGDRS